MKKEMDEEVVEQKIIKLQKAREIFLKIVSDNNINNEYMFLVKKEDADILANTLIYINDFTKKTGQNKVFVILEQGIDIASMLKKITLRKDIEVVCIFTLKDDIDFIIELYSLYEFTNKLIILSLDKPTGRQGNDLINSRKLTYDQMIKYGILHL